MVSFTLELVEEDDVRALSVKQPWAELIARGKKKIEYRSWKTKTLGDLLIVASASRQDEVCREHGLEPDALPYGRAVCVVELAKVTGDQGDYRWHVWNPRRVAAVPVTGYAAIYHVDDAKIRFTNESSPTKPTARKKTAPSRKARIPLKRDAPHVVVASRQKALAARWIAALRARGIRASACADGYAAWLDASARPGASVLLDHRVQGYSAAHVADLLNQSKDHSVAFAFVVGGSRVATTDRVRWIKSGASAEDVAVLVARAVVQPLATETSG